MKRQRGSTAGGAPEVVYDGGRPLILPIDATHEDLFRRIGGRIGRYRLDPVEADGRPIKERSRWPRTGK